MDEKIKISRGFTISAFVLMGIGVVTFIIGFLYSPAGAWGNFMVNNYYFLSLAIGASFFLAIQYITHSGWSAAFKRVPEAMMSYIPVAALFFVFLYFGMHQLYEWTHADVLSSDELVLHKSPYLNVPFFYIRLVVYFAAWILLIRVLRKLSLKEDEYGGLQYFHKSEFYSKVYIFVLAITFSLATIDWIKSIDVHWFSTMFAVKNFIAAFYHGTAVIAFIVILLNARGHFSFLNKYHIHDFARYIFILSIIWGYMWFAEFMLIWYGNIPEETFYYYDRWHDGWKVFFYLNIIINWAIPFVVLMPVPTSRNKMVLSSVIVILIIGQWIDLYQQVMPGVVGERNLTLIEIGTFLGYVGLFIFIVAKSLSRASLVPKNHPYLQESYQHHF